MSQRIFPVLAVVALGGAGLLWTAPLPVAAQSNDPLKMIEEQIGLVKDDRLTGYVRAVGARLAGHASTPTPLHFFVADLSEPNEVQGGRG